MTFKKYLKIVTIGVLPLLAVIALLTFFVMKLGSTAAQYAVTVVMALLIGFSFIKYIDWLASKGIL